MSNHIPKDHRVSALEKARSQNLERFHSLTTELETVKKNLEVISAQLIVMGGLVDPTPSISESRNDDH